MFGTSESIANINKTENDYKRIENVQVRELNSRAVEQFLKNDISIYIVLALMIYIIYNIYEYRDNGMWQIIYTAVNGRMRLAVKDTRCSRIECFICITDYAVMRSCLYACGVWWLGFPYRTCTVSERV